MSRSRCTTHSGELPSEDCERVSWRNEYLSELDNSMWLCSISCYRPQTNVARRGTNGERIHE